MDGQSMDWLSMRNNMDGPLPRQLFTCINDDILPHRIPFVMNLKLGNKEKMKSKNAVAADI